MTKKAINSIDDMKGLRIKANAENADIVTNLGARPGDHAGQRDL